MPKFSIPRVLTVLAASCVFTACSPKFDWRDYRSLDAPYTALFPGKPSTHTRTINLDGLQVSMTMTASDVDGSTFAVGSAVLPDAAMAPLALAAMKTALINNVGATVNHDKASSPAQTSATASTDMHALDINARGMQHGTPMLLVGRLLARDKQIYQVIVLAKEADVSRENIDMFLTSFKLN